MQNVTEYKTITGHVDTMSDLNTKDFIMLVNKHISEGWTPLGGIAITYTGSFYGIAMIQAMVKYN